MMMILMRCGCGRGQQKCPTTGELVYIGYNLVPTDGVPSVTVGVVASDGAVSRRMHVPCVRPSMQHDVAITRTRTVLMDGPLIFNIDKSLQGGRPFDFDMRYTLARCPLVPNSHE